MCHEPVEKKSETRLAAFVSWRSAAYLVLALTIGLAYGNSLKNSFVYDDHLQIVQNPNIKSLSGLRTYFQAPHKVVGPYEDVENYPYRPVFWVSLALDYFIWGVRPFGYHLTNVALHMLNAFLVFTLLLASLQARVLSFVTALLWALHPVHTEVVNSPSTRVVLLYALFYLLSLIFFLRGTDQARCNQLPWLVGGFIAFPLSLLSYEMAVTLPAIALLLDAARAKRSGTPIGASIRRNVPVHLVFLLSLIAYLVLRYLALPVSAPRGAGFAQGLWPRLLRVPSILTADLSLLAFPRSLSIHRSVSIPHPHSIFELDVLGSVLSIVLIALALGRLAKHCDGPLWGVAWFLLIESSVLNLVPIYRVAAERFLYLPSVGFLIAIVFAAGNLIDRLKSSRPQVKWSWYAAYLCS
ncbi:MAG: hypothetical protein HY278_06720, partial [candidate division NC10 bacterium]|nr:hypothetical protein [candidate division NC10 bacterium]